MEPGNPSKSEIQNLFLLRNRLKVKFKFVEAKKTVKSEIQKLAAAIAQQRVNRFKVYPGMDETRKFEKHRNLHTCFEN